MNEISRKKFLLKMSDSSQYRILYRNNGIAILKAAIDGSWSEIALLSGMHPCFYADVDSRDCMHIVSQDLSGSIVYSKIENGKLTSFGVLKSTKAAPFDRSLFMLNKNGSPVFFYTVRKESQTILVSQSFSGKAAAAPRPIAEVPDTVNPYWITQLGQNAGLILFPKVSGLYTQICAAKVRLDTPAITTEKFITTEEANCESPKCIVLPDGSIHMLYSIRKNGRFNIRYKKGSAASLDFSESETIAVSRQAFTKYNLEYSNGTLNINWLENGYIYFRDKKSTEAGFSDIQSFKSYRLRSMEYYHCKFNSTDMGGICNSTELPLSIDGKVQYAFYKEDKNRPVKPVHKKTESKEKEQSHPAANNVIFKALIDYLTSVEDFSTERRNDIQRIGDIAFQLSRLFAATNQRSQKQEKKKEPQKNPFTLGKLQGSHTFRMKDLR